MQTFARRLLRHSIPALRNNQIVSQTSSMRQHTTDALASPDPEQVRLMAEKVICVDANDKVCGSMSKKESHLIANNLPLHRAFSVFLFDTNGRMLLQQRSDCKITFPAYWTNTVCSHPLFTPSEMGFEDGGDEVSGAKRAAIRKLSHELGVKLGDVTMDDLHYMTRIRYRAECQDGIWGEHEVDYIFIVQKDVELEPKPNEVQAVKYLTQAELRSMIAQADSGNGILLTPWFRHIVDGFAWLWWDSVLSHGTARLVEFRDDKSIHAMGTCGSGGTS